LRCDIEAGLLQIIATRVLSLRSQAKRLRKKGTGDKIKGKVKEAVGGVTYSDHLRREGQAQQRKGHHEQKAAEARAVAEKHEVQAELSEDEKRARQVVRSDMRDEPVRDMRDEARGVTSAGPACPSCDRAPVAWGELYAT
jgi:uncharacterized protein YjbJ (UPF0337 family)